MKSLPEHLAEPRIARGVVLGLIGLCTLGVLVYVTRGTLDTVTRDEWRFLDMLRHWYDGQFSLADIWGTNTAGSEHRIPAFKLYFLADALWFDLDVRIGCWLGVTVLGVFALLLYRYFLRIRTGAQDAFGHYAFVPVALTVFSYTQTHTYTYDLLAVFTIIGTTLIAALWMQMDLRLRTPQRTWRYLVLSAGLMLLLLLFGAGKGPAIVLATAVLAVPLALQAQGGRGTSLRVLAWIGVGALAGELIYWHGGAGRVTGHGLGELLSNVFADLGGAVSYVVHALGAALVSAQALSFDDRAGRFATLGALVLAASVAALVIFLRTRMYRRSLLPLAFAVFTAAYLGELVVGRFGGGTDNGSAPRYVFTDHLLVVACVFVFADACRGLHLAGRQRRAMTALLALTLVVAYVEVRNLQVEYRFLDSQIRAQQTAIDAARTRLAGRPADYPRWYCPGDDLCDDGAQFLAAHKLSLFRTDTAPTP